MVASTSCCPGTKKKKGKDELYREAWIVNLFPDGPLSLGCVSLMRDPDGSSLADSLFSTK